MKTERLRTDHRQRDLSLTLALFFVCSLSIGDSATFAQETRETRESTTGLYELDSPRLKLVTDVPLDAELRSWPELLEQSLVQWQRFFGASVADTKNLKATVFLIVDLNKFSQNDLLQGVPAFEEGYQFGDRLFVREQPSIYYRRHLFLHEATHWIMWHLFGAGGSPWYMEGMADMQGTHLLNAGRLRLGVIPASPEQVPFWGRLKAIQETLKQGVAPSLSQILAYENDRDRTIRYSWSWAACVFFSNHPEYAQSLKEIRDEKLDYSETLSRKLKSKIGASWNEVTLDWNGFISDLDFGYDVERSMVFSGDPKSTKALSGEELFQLATDRGWQSTGLRVEAGKPIRFECQGRYTIRATPAGTGVNWESESQGITLEYFRQLPLGCVVASVQHNQPPEKTERWEAYRVGRQNTVVPNKSGLLFLKINEPSSGLHDNVGSVSVSISQP
jgi:hypothetical protein